MRRVLISLLAFLFLAIIFYIISVVSILKFGKLCTCYGIEYDYKCWGVHTPCFGLVGDIVPPKLIKSGPIRADINGKVLDVVDNFYFEPEEQCMGDLKARLVYVYDNSIVIDIMEEEGFDGSFTKVSPPKRVTIKDGTCIQAPQKCLDAYFRYCFSADQKTDPPTYTYEIRGESTMPLPGE